MPDGLDDLFDTAPNADPGQGGGKLRQQLEAVLAQNKVLQEQLAARAATDRSNAIGSLFGKHGIPELARDFFPSDVEPTDEAATSFVEKYGQLWGATAQPAATPPADQAATQAAQSFVSQAAAAPLAPMSEEEYAAKFAEAKTKDEFLRMLAELSVGV